MNDRVERWLQCLLTWKSLPLSFHASLELFSSIFFFYKPFGASSNSIIIQDLRNKRDFHSKKKIWMGDELVFKEWNLFRKDAHSLVIPLCLYPCWILRSSISFHLSSFSHLCRIHGDWNYWWSTIIHWSRWEVRVEECSQAVAVTEEEYKYREKESKK